MSNPQPLVVINVVALTPELIEYAPNVKKLAESGEMAPLEGVFPALTQSAQASMLTGVSPSEHGVVANGWYWRQTGEVRNWLQANAMLGAEPFYRTAQERAQKQGHDFSCAKMFWWFNQGSGADCSVTPKPHYGADGSKAFDVYTNPPELAGTLEDKYGKFPFFNFWGPMAGLASSQWIADSTATVIRDKRPSLTLAYLPHLDYDLQRFGPSGCDLTKLVSEVDQCAGRIIDAAKSINAKVLVVSEYGISDVSHPVYLNRELRKAGMLKVRGGPFGEMVDYFESNGFAVCDHQVAHVYVKNVDDITRVKELLEKFDGVSQVLDRKDQAQYAIDHQNAGELVALSDSDSWFAYPYWLDDRSVPDFARTIDIHRKPGYDPCELFLDPEIAAPKLKLAWRLLQKKLGFRTLMDVVPLDATLVRGSHGLPPSAPIKGPLIISSESESLPSSPKMTDFKDLALSMLGLTE